ncbi:hypothetical protein BP00DRAFT_172025 [Aspergillus indologenus CBS 114.80]|uniref:Uncharacterized protein n=1 Tax=Aspergillus indologenus CBS 114.80 TaxID=1450541 RepID=A0A2V5JHH3_9EURO|nr:hypothetical protein BP00DRAFT_172025 [Aspergillus indologenus CBS 114.80]
MSSALVSSNQRRISRTRTPLSPSLTALARLELMDSSVFSFSRPISPEEHVHMVFHEAHVALDEPELEMGLEAIVVLPLTILGVFILLWRASSLGLLKP